jgi:hypothetical protein
METELSDAWSAAIPDGKRQRRRQTKNKAKKTGKKHME